MYEGWDPRYEGNVAFEGGGIELDFVAAAKYYSLCCYAESTYALARMYEEGRGVVQNFQEAERLLKIAAADDNFEAIFRLACMYEDGRRLGQDFERAAELCVRRNVSCAHNESSFETFGQFGIMLLSPALLATAHPLTPALQVRGAG